MFINARLGQPPRAPNATILSPTAKLTQDDLLPPPLTGKYQFKFKCRLQLEVETTADGQ